MKLKVFGIRLEAAHAAYRWEQEMGTLLEVDFEIAYRRMPEGDRLARVITVEDVVSHVHRVSEKKIYTVLEALAADILDTFWKTHKRRISEALVRVRKIRPKSDRRIAGYEVELQRPQ